MAEDLLHAALSALHFAQGSVISMYRLFLVEQLYRVSASLELSKVHTPSTTKVLGSSNGLLVAQPVDVASSAADDGCTAPRLFRSYTQLIHTAGRNATSCESESYGRRA